MASSLVATDGIHILPRLSIRYDPDVWYKLREDGEGYDYIATYVDDFLISAKDAWSYMRHLQSIYTIKEPAHPEIYLGALYTGQPSQDWTISCKNYIKEAITRIECQYGTLKEKTPSIMGDRPEQDDSTILDNEQHREYQSLIGMAQWLVTLGRLDICYAVLSLLFLLLPS